MSGKRFNWVDAVIILLVLAVGLGGWTYLNRMRGGTGLGTPETQELYFVFETMYNNRHVAEQFEAAVGTNVIFGERRVDRGVITHVDIVPYEKEIEDKINGRWVVQPIDGLWNARVTIRFTGFDTPTAFRGTQEQVMVGRQTIIEGLGVASEGVILDVGRVVAEEDGGEQA
jgi:hypothetical protein